MSAYPASRDYCSINTTKIYTANPSGNFTVTSLPLTNRHLQDIESLSSYNLLFDLVANKFSNTPLYRGSAHHFATPFEASATLRLHQTPSLSVTRSAEAVLSSQQREDRQIRGHTTSSPSHTLSPNYPPPTPYLSNDTAHRPQSIWALSNSSADTTFVSPRRARPRSSPYKIMTTALKIPIGRH